ncbi:MAG: hypothetical protein JXB03_12100 [Spirochaetales bacterium]|nr:hypothetical protein [Spirochaetales bacterium]
MKRTVIFVLLIFLAALAAGETLTTVTLTQMAGIAQGLDEEPMITGAGTGKVSFMSAGNRDVKAELSLSAVIGQTSLIDIEKAYIKARFPAFRTLVGKTRLSWGDGFFFNAGDVIFGSTNPLADLTGDEIRTDTLWIASAFIPLGRFSFAETVVVPPQIDVAYEFIRQTNARIEEEPYLPPAPAADSAWAGARIQGKIAQIKTEGGYLYKGSEGSHRPYISAQGNLYVDWYASASATLSDGTSSGRDILDSSLLSFGLFHIAKPSRNITLNLRIEGLVSPGGRWQEGTDLSAPGSNADYYGVYLYPEISAGFPGSRNLFLRGVYSPIDSSGLVTAGASWNIYQGFSVLGYATLQAGEDTDQFCVKRYSGYAITMGIKYVY